ncbi:hypothetical protein SAMN05216368_105190 [Cryobacterium flavum]|uniref:Uncharacterized protein n=1 Tax=Cryobacterium flavum TaxID=1424659 RepID=A0A5E9FZ61_9MICO|nr:hypothetical protein SAMN05216368_105190 [Cryobacterium flavum]
MAQNPKQSNKVARAASSGGRNARFSAAADTAAARARALTARTLEARARAARTTDDKKPDQ